MKLLIAEDDAFFRKSLKQLLESEYELIFANDGDEAWMSLQKSDAPRLAILDWIMPGLSGPQLCRNVRACTRLSSMYLILFTGRNSTADVISGFRAGADDYITKPFDPQELRVRVRLGKLVLDLQDAAELRVSMGKGRSEFEYNSLPPVTERPLAFDPAEEGHLSRVQDCLIESIAMPVTSGVHPFETSHRLPPQTMRYFIESPLCMTAKTN